MNHILKPNEIQTKLTREQKEAVGLLSIGTFLEYFDLMLYVHMAVLLNELFFPKTDPHTAQLLSAFTFCSTYVFRPFGALFFGWLGDKIGRKYTIIITTILMGLCCAAMASCPTYADIGISAAYVMVACRVLQGVASMGEVVGALLYLTEFIKKPSKYFAVSLIDIFCNLGSVCAIFFATLAVSVFHNWRAAFIFGATLAAMGIMARTRLRETPEFADAALRMKKIKELDNINLTDNYKEFFESMNASNKKSYFALFLLECLWPLCFYFIYIYCGDLLKNSFGYTSEQVISHNLVITIILLLSTVLNSLLCKYFHPMLIFKYRFILSIGLYVILPFWLSRSESGFEIGVIQTMIILFNPYLKAAVSAIYSHFPVMRRFKAASVLYALSRAITYVITTFGMVYLVDWYGNFGIFIAFAIAALGTWYGLNHFWKLEEATGDLKTFAVIRKEQWAR